MNVADLALAATVKSDVAIAIRVATGLCGRSIRCTDLSGLPFLFYRFPGRRN